MEEKDFYSNWKTQPEGSQFEPTWKNNQKTEIKYDEILSITLT